MAPLHYSPGSEPGERNADWAPYADAHPSLNPQNAQSASDSSPAREPRILEEAKLAVLIELGRELMRQNYAWICPSEETQNLVNGRFANRRAFGLADLFGWNRVGTMDTLAHQLPAELIKALCEVGVLQVTDGESVRSRVRFSKFADILLAHSSWPATQSDDVIVGPDTQRFGAFVAREMLGPSAPMTPLTRPFTVVHLNCGAGAAGILAARMLTDIAGDRPTRVLLTDRNPQALLFAEVNARIANLSHFECRRLDLLEAVTEPPMLVLANPPGLMDAQRRPGHHGGGELGTGIAVRTVDECIERMLPGGTLIMCAIAPVVRGVDILLRSLEPRIMRTRLTRPTTLRYEVLETDVCAHQLALPDYAEVDRLAFVGLCVQVKAFN